MQEENILKFIEPVFFCYVGFDAEEESLSNLLILRPYATRRFCQLSFIRSVYQNKK